MFVCNYTNVFMPEQDKHIALVFDNPISSMTFQSPAAAASSSYVPTHTGGTVRNKTTKKRKQQKEQVDVQREEIHSNISRSMFTRQDLYRQLTLHWPVPVVYNWHVGGLSRVRKRRQRGKSDR